MKKVKIIAASLAFLVAIGGTYAFKTLPRTLFEQTPTACIETDCHLNPNDINPATGLPGTPCPVQAYQTKVNATTCADEVDGFKKFQ